jgi:hypothetical protein
MVQPGPDGFSQIYMEELDDEQIVVRSVHCTCEVVILQPDVAAGFSVVFGDVARRSKVSQKMSVEYSTSEYLGTRLFGTKATSFAIIEAPATWVPCELLGLHVVIPRAMPPIHLRF